MKLIQKLLQMILGLVCYLIGVICGDVSMKTRFLNFYRPAEGIQVLWPEPIGWSKCIQLSNRALFLFARLPMAFFQLFSKRKRNEKCIIAHALVIISIYTFL
jgi:hypothetical protein